MRFNTLVVALIAAAVVATPVLAQSRETAPPTSPILRPFFTATATPNPAEVIAGDTLTIDLVFSFNFQLTTGLSVGITLPGNTVGDQTSNDSFDLVSAGSTVGSCTGGLRCNFGNISGGGTNQVVELALRAKRAGAFTLGVRPVLGTPLDVPVTVEPRLSDLGARFAASKAAVRVGKAAQDGVAANNSATLVVTAR